MSQTTWNKATVPAGTDPWNTVPDIKKALDSAGLVIPVSSTTERNGLAASAPGGVLRIGTMVVRTDLAGAPSETWDGSNWVGADWVSYTPSWGGWINLGSGYVSTGSYYLVGKLCHVRMKLLAGGAGVNLGTGALAVTLPFTSAAGQSTNGDGQWLGSGQGGGIQRIMLSNPESNNMAAIYTNPSGTSIAVPPGAGGFGYGSSTEVHATITYRIA